jgi:transglutaminase-like putative cysteine protease
MKLLTVRHATTYRYSQPVRLDEHRLMIRPRDSHDLRLVHSTLTLSPPGTVRWHHDVFGNSVAVVTFAEPATQLDIVSTLDLERYGIDRLNFPVAEEAATYPFAYSNDDRRDLGRLRDPHGPDARGTVAGWAQQFIKGNRTDTLDLLAAMNGAIKSKFNYVRREEEGTQSPADTIERRSGSCRDFAWLFIEAARCLGFGARFVSGYIYDPSTETNFATTGGGATHAWAEIYLPGAGWIEYDPTNSLIAEERLIRVAVTRMPSQAVPVSGSFTGARASCLALEVDVTVKSSSEPQSAP